MDYCVHPRIEIGAGDVPELPRVLTRDVLQTCGCVESVQVARYQLPKIRAVNPTACSLWIQQAYVDSLKMPFVRVITQTDGCASYKIGSRTLIDLSEPKPVDGIPGLTSRIVEGGRLVPESERGRGSLQIRVTPLDDSSELLVEVRLSDYRSALRGTAERAPFRQALYRLTQMPLHRRVCVQFLRGLSLEPLLGNQEH